MSITPKREIEYSITVDIPPGYHPLPLTNIDQALQNAAGPITEAAPDALNSSVSDVLGVLEFFLKALAARRTVYCGVGRHLTEAGEQVTSWITISLLQCGDPQNPRLVVQDFAMNKLAQDPSTVVEPVEADGRPMLFSEFTRRFPAPDLSAYEGRSDDVTVFQLEALVPSDDGTNVAVIEFSTLAVDSGPLYGEMLFGMATSIDFTELTPAYSSLNL